MIYDQTVTWTAFAILAMFSTTSHYFQPGGCPDDCLMTSAIFISSDLIFSLAGARMHGLPNISQEELRQDEKEDVRMALNL